MSDTHEDVLTGEPERPQEVPSVADVESDSPESPESEVPETSEVEAPLSETPQTSNSPETPVEHVDGQVSEVEEGEGEGEEEPKTADMPSAPATPPPVVEEQPEKPVGLTMEQRMAQEVTAADLEETMREASLGSSVEGGVAAVDAQPTAAELANGPDWLFGDEETDEYGFMNDPDDPNVKRYGFKSVDKISKEEHAKREAEWLDIIFNKWESVVTTNSGKKRLKAAVRKGIPRSLRGRVWFMLSGASVLHKNNPELFAKMSVGEPEKVTADQIDRDINRTFPHHQVFRKEGGMGQTKLRTVLRAYACFNPAVGYCQGMGFIVATLLLHLDEAESFYTLVSLLDSHSYFRGYFGPKLVQARMDCKVLGDLLKQKYPKVAKKLAENYVAPEMFAVQWLMTMFCIALPWNTVLRIWDAFFLEGVKVTFRVALAIFDVLKPKIMAADDLTELLPMLQKLDPDLTQVHVLFPRVFAINLKRSEIVKAHRRQLKEWESDVDTLGGTGVGIEALTKKEQKRKLKEAKKAEKERKRRLKKGEQVEAEATDGPLADVARNPESQSRFKTNATLVPVTPKKRGKAIA